MLERPEGMRVVGLTGGIASGKSEVARAWRGLGIPVIDADAVARRQMRPGGPVHASVVDAFGPGILSADGSIDRAALAAVVFADPGRRRRLEAITHGEVLREVSRRLEAIARTGCRLAVVEAALVVETGLDAGLDGVVSVTAPEDARIRRAIARDGVDEPAIRARIAAQADDARRIAASRAVLPNDADLDTLHRRARSLAIDVLLWGVRDDAVPR